MEDKIRMMISEEEIAKRVGELAEQINEKYKGKEITLICILKGSIFFTADLARRLNGPVKMEYMRCSSYGDSTNSSGEVKVVIDVDCDIEGKDVIVVEDIVDTGRTLWHLMNMLKERKPQSLALAALLDKPERRVKEVAVDYVGFTIPDEFVVGYGLDFAQKHRELPYIGVVENE